MDNKKHMGAMAPPSKKQKKEGVKNPALSRKRLATAADRILNRKGGY